MKSFIEFLNESSENYTVQIGYDFKKEYELMNNASKNNVTVKRTTNRPIDLKDDKLSKYQYLVSGTETDVKKFLIDFGLVFYNQKRFIVKKDKNFRSKGNYTVQIGYNFENEDKLQDIALEGNVTVKRTNNKPISRKETFNAQYLVSGNKKYVIDFLNNYGFLNYIDDKFVTRKF